MDTAVALVNAYLHVNGYLTVAEYPVIEAYREGRGYRTVTDLDMLAVRFPGAGRWVPGKGGTRQGVLLPPDPELGVSGDETDMIIGEVKEGRAGLNPGLRSRTVLETALVRFGCCGRTDVPDVSTRLLEKGHARTRHGHNVRFVAFGSSGDKNAPCHTTIGLGHVLGFLDDYIREYWDVLHNADFKDSAFGLLVLMEKTRFRKGRKKSSFQTRKPAEPGSGAPPDLREKTQRGQSS